MEKDIEYLYQPEYDGLYKIDGVKHYYYNLESGEWEEDEYDNDDVYFYKNKIQILTEKEMNKKIKELENDTRKRSSK